MAADESRFGRSAIEQTLGERRDEARVVIGCMSTDHGGWENGFVQLPG